MLGSQNSRKHHFAVALLLVVEVGYIGIKLRVGSDWENILPLRNIPIFVYLFKNLKLQVILVRTGSLNLSLIYCLIHISRVFSFTFFCSSYILFNYKRGVAEMIAGHEEYLGSVPGQSQIEKRYSQE